MAQEIHYLYYVKLALIPFVPGFLSLIFVTALRVMWGRQISHGPTYLWLVVMGGPLVLLGGASLLSIEFGTGELPDVGPWVAGVLIVTILGATSAAKLLRSAPAAFVFALSTLAIGAFFFVAPFNLAILDCLLNGRCSHPGWFI